MEAAARRPDATAAMMVSGPVAASPPTNTSASRLAPVSASDVPAPDKAVLLGRIFQILLLTRLAPLLSNSETES